ncbi:hypothetical protein [Pseudonocardia sp. DSM 110487]|uniref:hypothetical protein n=1 Tax=Pseudonocardia sp. DSM 110487 TaxID=2865833 RepID=UPI0021034019|nr:hypothetical protein [Pseudonocardia sp. DSM 110487]
MSRRRVLAGLLLLPPAVAGCALGRAAGPTEPDPLIALADAARADAALAAAAVATDQGLASALQPLVEARTQHAAALDAEVARLNPSRPTPAPSPRPSGRPGRAEVQQAVLASGRAAGDVALGLPPERVGLVASVAACCSTYAEVLT